MKGIAFAIVLVAVVAALVIGGFYLNVLIGEQVNTKKMAKEIELIKAANSMEAIKKSLPYCLYYSYSEAMDRGGYESFSDVKDENVFKEEVLIIFDEYRDQIKEKTSITIPAGNFGLLVDNEELTINFISKGLLTYEYSSPELSFNISDNANTTIKIKNGQLIEYF